MQDNLGLVELFLDLHDAVGLMGVLVLDNVLFERGKRQFGVGVGKGRAGVTRQELVDDLGEKLMGDKGGVFLVGDDDSGDSLTATVGVKGVGLFLDILALAWFGSLGDRLAEEGHELANAACRVSSWLLGGVQGCCYLERVKRE